MANNTENKTEIKTENKVKMVKIMVPLVPGKGDIYPCVNGEEYTIKRGEYVEVPWYIAEVIENSLHQEAATARLIEKLKK